MIVTLAVDLSFKYMSVSPFADMKIEARWSRETPGLQPFVTPRPAMGRLDRASDVAFARSRVPANGSVGRLPALRHPARLVVLSFASRSPVTSRDAGGARSRYALCACPSRARQPLSPVLVTSPRRVEIPHGTISYDRSLPPSSRLADRHGHREKRRGRDLNPGGACTPNGFRDRPVRPLRHPSWPA